MRREASHTDSGDGSIEFYRPQQHDVLIYDASADELGVHANTKGEVKLYCSCLGRFLFSDAEHFPSEDKYTLDPLVDLGPAALACEDIRGLREVRLVELRRFWGGAFKELETRKATDLFAAMQARGRPLAKGGRLASATFKARFDDSPKERTVTIRPPGYAGYERNEDSEMIDLWLRERGFARRLSGDADDDEAPTAVLAGT